MQSVCRQYGLQGKAYQLYPSCAERSRRDWWRIDLSLPPQMLDVISFSKNTETQRENLTTRQGLCRKSAIADNAAFDVVSAVIPAIAFGMMLVVVLYEEVDQDIETGVSWIDDGRNVSRAQCDIWLQTI